MFKVGIGHDSHRFEETKTRPLRLGGVEIPYHRSLQGNSDADVVLHALTQAISSITGVNILGEIADELCQQKGIKDSAVYLKEALKYLETYRIVHVSVSIECLEPKLSPYIENMRQRIAEILEISPQDVGITATTGDGLTSFGRGKGVQVFAVITAVHDRILFPSQ